MRICTWNINSAKARAELLAAFLDRVAPTILGLQELKVVDEELPREVFESRGYHVVSQGQRTYNGVALAARMPIREVVRGFPGDEGQSRLIAARIGGLRVLNLYCPQGSEVDSPKYAYKLRFYDALIDWVAEWKPDLIMGDLNIAPLPEDVWDPVEMKEQVSFTAEEHARWARLLALGYADLVRGFVGPRAFTFWDYRESCFARDRGMRIDHHLGTSALAARVQGARVLREEREREKASDHAPVLLEVADP